MKKSFWSLTAFALVSSIGSSMVMPYIPIYGKEIGMSVTLAGILVFVFYGMDTLARIPIGSLSGLIGYHRVVLSGGFSIFLASILYIISGPFPKLLFLAQLFFGIGFSVTWVTIPSYITLKKQSLAIYSFFVGVGWFLGPPLGGYIKDSLGMGDLFIGFFIHSVILIFISLIFYYVHRPKFDYGRKINNFSTEVATSYIEGKKIAMKGGRVVIAFAVSFVMFMAFSMAYSLVPLYFEAIGLISFQIGILQSFRQGSSTVVRLGLRKILNIADDVTVLTVGMFGTGISIILISMIESTLWLTVFSVMWGLSAGMYFPIVIDLIAKGTDEKERGVALGVRGTIGTLGSAVGVLLFSGLADTFSVHFSLGIVGTFVVGFGAFIWIIWKYFMKKGKTDKN
ncbi:MAG: MFS transporter [Thermoplasmatota archaeon]